jgi:hypothetical protein
MKYKIEYVKKKMKGGYIGMNKQSAIAKNIPFKHPEHTIEVFKKVPKKVRVHTIRHEQAENYLMRNLHYKYPFAHSLALKFEKVGKPFPKRDIKKKLIKWGILK